MTFLDFFAGIGGFRRGLELTGHKCLGFCEWDKYAVASYTSMHCITDEQREYLSTLDLKHRQKEILKDEYRNGEWYAADIRSVDAGSLPRADCWCFGFPCQDISVAGKQAGFKGNRSSLFFATTKLIRDLEEKDRPELLLIENVKNLLSVNRGFDFARLLVELDEIGYDAEWQVLNSKDFGVPQNRERIYIVGHLRGGGQSKVFPFERTSEKNYIHKIGRIHKGVSGRVIDGDGISPTLSTRCDDDINLLTTHDDCNKYSIWNSGYQQYIAIRMLTPKECFRLQGWTDDYFDRAQFVNSDSQLYKQAGNGVTVNVIEAIGERING